MPKYKTRDSLLLSLVPKVHSLCWAFLLNSRHLSFFVSQPQLWHEISPFINLESIMLPILQFWVLLCPPHSSCKPHSSVLWYPGPTPPPLLSELSISHLSPCVIQLITSCNRYKKYWVERLKGGENQAPVLISGLQSLAIEYIISLII